jgi:hypothetical protein
MGAANNGQLEPGRDTNVRMEKTPKLRISLVSQGGNK